MVSMTVQLDETLADRLKQLAEVRERTPEELVVEAVIQYAQHADRPLPKGMGAYRSGQTQVSQSAEEILQDAARTGRWP